MRKVGLVFKNGHEQALALAEQISHLLAKFGKEALVEDSFPDLPEKLECPTNGQYRRGGGPDRGARGRRHNP